MGLGGKARTAIRKVIAKFHVELMLAWTRVEAVEEQKVTGFGVDVHAQGKADRMCWLTRRRA